MKKLFLSAAVIAVMAMTSCSTTGRAKDAGEELKAKIENCNNVDSLKVYVKQAQDYAQKLISEGKDDAAKAYLSEVAPIVSAKAPGDSSIFDELNDEVDSVKSDATDKTKAVVDSVSGTVKSVTDKVGNKVEDAKDAVSKAADKAKSATTEAVGKAKSATTDAVQSGADKIKDAFGK